MQTNPASGIFVQRLISHMPDWVNPLVITPATQFGDAIQVEGKPIPVKVFGYAPKSWQLIAHYPGGIPVALNNKKALYLLLPCFLLAEFISTALNSARSHLIHANWSINGFIAGLIGKILSKPVITTLRGEDITRAKKYSIDRFILRHCIRWSSIIVCVNRSYKDWLRDIFPDMENKIHTIENGVDDYFRQVGETRETSSNSSPSTLKLLTVGSLIKRKRISDIIRALKIVNDNNVTLTIIGDGPENEKLRNMVNDYNLKDQVNFTGSVNPDKLVLLLASHDAFILSSESEGRPNVVLEAMATKLPVIATKLPGITEFITDNVNGLLFETGNTEKLSTLIKRIKNDPELKRSLGTAALDYIKQHKLTWSDAANQYTELYQSLIPQQR